MSSTVIDDVNKVLKADTKTYISAPIMSKYEFNTLIGLRTAHLAGGMKPLVSIPADFKITTDMEWREIAERELLEGRLPYIVKRIQPNGNPEYWDVDKLDLVAVRNLFRYVPSKPTIGPPSNPNP